MYLLNKEKNYCEQIKILRNKLKEKELKEMNKKNKKLSNDKHQLKKDFKKNDQTKKAMREKLFELFDKKEKALKEACKMKTLDRSKLKKVGRGGYGKSV